MKLYAFNSIGFEGQIISIEIDIRKGIPGMNVVGLPTGAVKESKDRVKIAITNSGFYYPQDKILINLSPAGMKKGGASYDLSIALSILIKSGQIEIKEELEKEILVLGELKLDGSVLGIEGVLPAITTAKKEGIKYAIVPADNFLEAIVIDGIEIIGVSRVEEVAQAIIKLQEENTFGIDIEEGRKNIKKVERQNFLDFSEIEGMDELKRTLQIAVAGYHNVLLVGPPGGGKTLSAKCIQSILPEMDLESAIETSQIYSIAGESLNNGLLIYPPFRMPHHSASLEGIVGGGKNLRPGEISLANRGVLLLDEAPEFAKEVLQSLREPLEDGKIILSRADSRCWYPANFMLIMTMNPCPCGNYTSKRIRDNSETESNTMECACSMQDISKYWAKIGGALLDRIAIKMEVGNIKKAHKENELSSKDLMEEILIAKEIQAKRFKKTSTWKNSDMKPAEIREFCKIDSRMDEYLSKVTIENRISHRGTHSILTLSRTISDMKKKDNIGFDELEEAVNLRLLSKELP